MRAAAGYFDNMNDRPIKGQTDGTEYSLVVNVPENATGIAFGLMLSGKGQVWLVDLSFDEVDESVALTGSYTMRAGKKAKNLNFEV